MSSTNLKKKKLNLLKKIFFWGKTLVVNMSGFMTVLFLSVDSNCYLYGNVMLLSCVQAVR